MCFSNNNISWQLLSISTNRNPPMILSFPQHIILWISHHASSQLALADVFPAFVFTNNMQCITSHKLCLSYTLMYEQESVLELANSYQNQVKKYYTNYILTHSEASKASDAFCLLRANWIFLTSMQN